jgi:gluconolactonase
MAFSWREVLMLKATATLVFTMACFGQVASTAYAQAPSSPKAVHEAVPTAKIIRKSPALDAVIAPGAKIERVVSGLLWAEGPMWHKGALWFSDLSGNKMYSLTPDGKLKVMLEKSGGLPSFPAGEYGGSNGMVAEKNGTVLMMQHGLRRIVHLDDAMNVKVFLDKYQGQPFNSPNDLVFTADGALYFTDPPYGFYKPTTPDADPDKDSRHVMKFNGVFRYKDGKLTAAITDLPRPNGLAFSQDGKTFYVSNSQNPRALYTYDVKPNGSLVNKRLFADLSKEPGDGNPDGMKIDSLGNIWASGPGGFRIFSPKGELLGQIILPEVESNVAWGGSDGMTAYFTAATSIYKLALKVPGKLPVYR